MNGPPPPPAPGEGGKKDAHDHLPTVNKPNTHVHKHSHYANYVMGLPRTVEK